MKVNENPRFSGASPRTPDIFELGKRGALRLTIGLRSLGNKNEETFKMMDDVAARGLVLLGCGKMGSAMLAGWLNGGLPAASVYVLDPYPSDWLRGTGVHINAELPSDPAVTLVAVKPQMMGDALPAMQALGNGQTQIVSIAAGTPIARFEAELGARTPIVRSMPNTPRDTVTLHKF